MVREERFAGIDWASDEHAVCVNDNAGRIVEGRRFGRDERGIRALCTRLIPTPGRVAASGRQSC